MGAAEKILRGYLTAAAAGSMSRNNAEQLAHELGEQIYAAMQENRDGR